MKTRVLHWRQTLEGANTSTFVGMRHFSSGRFAGREARDAEIIGYTVHGGSSSLCVMLRYLCRFREFTVLRYVCSVSNSTSHNSDSCLELCFLSLQLVALVAWCGGLRQRAQLRARARHKPLGNDVPG